jgi:hypothetical protein
MAARSDYGANPLAGAARNNAQQHGWGSGWPNAQTAKMTTVSAAGIKVRVRREIAELVETLLLVTEKFGYDCKPGQCWGFADRPIRGTRTASNHSWGLAVDINSLANPMGTRFVTDLPPKVVHAWETCGFYWGGRYEQRPDAMHFEYVRRPQDVAADLVRARQLLSPVSAPPLDKSLLMKQWRIDKAALSGQRPTEHLSQSEQHWVNWYRRSYGILLARKKVRYDLRESTLSLTKKFQKAYGLVPDGIPGPKTADMLRRLAHYRIQD